MAHHKSAKKRIKQTEKRRMINKMKRSRTTSQEKKLREAIELGKKDEAQKLLVETQSLLSKLAKTSALQKSAASRKTSNLARQVAKI